MSRRRKTRWRVAALVSGALIVVMVVGAVFVRRPRLTPELRGQRLATRLGCFACHGPGGKGGVPNPGSDEREVPAWDGGTAMMYVDDEQEIREWILYGKPRDHDEDDDDEEGPHALPIDMPAFGEIVSERELEDLVAYFKAVSAFEKPGGEARHGYRVAARLGCFGCHGPGGLVGGTNAGAFKGYIPPWRGKDFAMLVEDDDELRQWILEGTIDRFESNPLGRFFTRRQVIQMPAYEDALQPGELDAIIAYIRWLQSDGD